MTTVAAKEQKNSEILRDDRYMWSGEVVVLCPKCKALQTLQIAEDTILPTRKYTQKNTQIYHDCGAAEPCRLYRIL